MTDAQRPGPAAGPSGSPAAEPGATSAEQSALEQARVARPRRAASVSANRITALTGAALALTATDPAQPSMRGPFGWLAAAVAVVAALWAAPAVVQRPITPAVTWTRLLARHRNTVFAVGCVVVAGFGSPPFWLAAADTALMLAYLLAVDALAAGPVGVRQLRRGVAPAAAAGALVLLAAQAPVDAGVVWGRIAAAIAVAAAALAAGAALINPRDESRRNRTPPGQ
jgi:hypothetical protein